MTVNHDVVGSSPTAGVRHLSALCQVVLLAIKSMGEEVIFSMTFSPVFIFFFN